MIQKNLMKIYKEIYVFSQIFLDKRYFNHKSRLNRCWSRIFHEKLHISMYIRHIDHRSGAPWGPHGREGGKNFFAAKGAPWGGPMGGPGAWGPLGEPMGGPPGEPMGGPLGEPMGGPPGEPMGGPPGEPMGGPPGERFYNYV